MKSLQPTTLVDEGIRYAESPRWHDGRLWFSDVHDGAVKAVDESGAMEVVLRVDHPSGLGWLPDGTLLISTLMKALLLQAEGGEAHVVADLSDIGWSTNDMVVGPGGAAYVDLYTAMEEPPPGKLVLRQPDGTVRVVADGLSCPNGMAITADGSTLVVSETFTGRILAFTITADGSLTDQRVFADLGAERRPDGVCLDEAGAAWVGSAHTGEFLRVLEGGEITHRIETPGSWAVATALGGSDRRTLFMVVAETSQAGLGSGDSRGRLDQVRVDVPGAGWP